MSSALEDSYALLRNLTWKKTPGMDKISASLERPEDQANARAAVVDMAKQRDISRAEPGDGILFGKGAIEVNGRTYLEVFVSKGIPFNGANHYLSEAQGRA